MICNRADLDKAIDWLPKGKFICTYHTPGTDFVTYRNQRMYRERKLDQFGAPVRGDTTPWWLESGPFLVAPWLVDELPGLREFL